MVQLYCMAYITTNIRFEEEQYHELKQEALNKKKSLSALIRDKVGAKKKKRSKKDIAKLMVELSEIAKRGNMFKGNKTAVEVVREMRDNAKW